MFTNWELDRATLFPSFRESRDRISTTPVTLNQHATRQKYAHRKFEVIYVNKVKPTARKIKKKKRVRKIKIYANYIF